MRDILLTSSALILALLVLRRLFRNTLSRRAQYALWGLVLLRLLAPVSLPSADFSLLTAAEPIAGRMESLYIQPLRGAYRGENDAPVYGPPNTPPVAIGPAREDNTYTFHVQDNLDTEVEASIEFHRQIALADLFRPIWYGGMAVMTLWMLLSNLLFWRKLRRARTPWPVEGFARRVYLVKSGLSSPCLFGLFRPAIYLTPAALSSPESLRHVLVHEETHARHLDPLWSLLRGVCLVVYWFDPLVWWAALASREDCELACDEGALRRLEEAERIPYGRTLLSLIPLQKSLGNPLLSATTMTSDKKRLKDRITRIAENRKSLGTALFAAVALAALACAVTFTGAKKTEPRPLTKEELAYFNGEFFTEDCGQGKNRRRYFLNCIYDRPEDINLYELLFNGTGLPEELSRADIQFIEDHRPGADTPVFYEKISIANLDAFLLENTGIGYQNTRWNGLDKLWWNENGDTYYHIYQDSPRSLGFTARRDPEPVVFTSGQREGSTVRLHYEGGLFSTAEGYSDYISGPLYASYSTGPLCVTLREKPEGGWLFVSNQWDNMSLAPAWPDWEPLYTIPLNGLEPYEPEIAEPIRFPPGPKMLDSPGDPEHILGDHSLSFFQNGDGDEIFAGVQNKLLSSWPQPFWSFRPGKTGTYSVSFFRNLMGHDGFCITTDNSASSQYPSRQSDYYYLNEDGLPVLLARAEGWSEMIDLDGDGQKELVSLSRYAEALCFRRDENYYQVNLNALLKDCWPQGTDFYYDSWDPGSRRLIFRAWIPSAAGAAAVENPEHRALYFDGENLLIYNDQRQPGDHLLEWFDIRPEVRDYALSLAEAAWDEAGGAYDDWRITSITSLGTHYTGADPQIYEAWQVWYEFHTEAANGKEPWVSLSGPGYLYFELAEDQYIYLYSEKENEFPPGLSQFWAAMEDRLVWPRRLYS